MLTTKMNRLSQVIQMEGPELNFQQLASTLRDQLPGASVYIVSRSGKLLGVAITGDFESTPFDAEWIQHDRMPDELATALLTVGAPAYGEEAERILHEPNTGIFPIVGKGQRIGTLVVVGAHFDRDAELLIDYAATVSGLVLAYALGEEENDEAEERRMARSAIMSLSYSEILAVQRIFDELEGDEGLLVASRIADEAGITRSVIVNALRKLASANVIESRSLGMKGTYLRVLNQEIRNELARHRFPYPKPIPMQKRRA